MLLQEDFDDDNDLVTDSNDLCPQGQLNWTSNSTTDWDNDGCHDVTEDTDDDNDGVIDSNDICPNTIVTGYVNSDGCLDSDKDGVLDSVDDCPTGSEGWIANSTNDYDMDGCLDQDTWLNARTISHAWIFEDSVEIMKVILTLLEKLTILLHLVV